MFTNIINGIRYSFGITNSDADDAVTQSPSELALPPYPFFEDSQPATETERVVVDLSLPTESPSPSLRKESHSEMSHPRPPRTERSQDEKRLVGDYSKPADAVNTPDPLTWMPSTKRPIITKPGSNSGFKPVNTMHAGPNAPSRKPFTYTKRDRLHSPLIGQAHGTGQSAYLQQLKENKVPATTARRVSSQENHDRWSGGAMPGKRRKTDEVISLVDDDDEVLEVSRTGQDTSGGTSRDRPRSARSPHSRMSNGSGSTINDIKPPQTISEFREADSLLRPSQKKPRNSSSNTSKSGVRHSPFGGGSLSTSPHANPARQAILLGFQQGEAKQSPTKHDRAGNKVNIFTSHHFPNARINESTWDRREETQRVPADSEDLRVQHKPVPKQSDPSIDSYSADELAITPPQQGTKSFSKQKQKQAANSGAKRNTHKKSLHDVCRLSFARSYDYDGPGSTLNESHTKLVLRDDLPDAWRVQVFDQVEGNYETAFHINPKDVNKVHADETGHVRLEGPRKPDGNTVVFDLEFINPSEFLLFRDNYAVSMTPNGKFVPKAEEHMLRLFRSPLRPKNEKVGTTGLVHDPLADTKQDQRPGNGTSKTTIVDQMKHAVRGSRADSGPTTTTGSAVLTRPSRSRKSAPIYDVEDISEHSNVPKFSVDKGLGERWTKSLEFGEGRQRAIVHFDDLPRLDEEEFLNDSLIDFYMIYLFKQLKVPADKVYFFNTYFFTKLTENSGRKSMDYKAVERWTSKIDIFGYDYIVVPINEQAHWYLAIICNMSKIQRKAIIQDYDEPQGNAQDQANISAMAASTSEYEGNTTQKPTSSAEPTVTTEALAQMNDEDPNLFEEDLLSLVNREDTGAESTHESETTLAESTSQNPKAEGLTVTKTTSDVKNMHPGILSQSQSTASSAKKKAKGRPVPKRDPDQPVIIVLDSLGGNARTGAVRALKDWIAAEGLNRRAMEAVIKENGYYPKSTQVPMQNNFTDCGVYLLGYIEKFFQNPDDFKNKLLTGSMSAQEDWPELDPSEMRHKMRQIIFDCYKKQEDDRRAQKKAKKGSASSKTSPAPVTYEAMDSGGRKSEESRTGGTKFELSPQNTVAEPASAETQSPSHIPHRLGSPFRFDAQRAPSAKQSPQAAVSKVSDSPPLMASPVKQAIGSPRPEVTPRRQSPEVRIFSRTPQSHGSTPNGQITSDRPIHPLKTLHQTGHTLGTSSPRKRRRHENDYGQVQSPTAKRHSTRSPQHNRGWKVESEQSASRSREGSDPNAPIEINDSQEVKSIDADHRQQIQASSLAKRKPSSRHPLPFEEIPRLSSNLATSEHGRHEDSSVDDALRAKLDEDDHARDEAWHSKAPAPSDADVALEHREEVSDPMDGISQSTHDLQLDGLNDGSVVRETPEPEERCPPAVQSGWSRDDPLLL